jgi:hypothetical protein
MTIVDSLGNAAKITKYVLIYPALNGTLDVVYPTFGGINMELEYGVKLEADNIR